MVKLLPHDTDLDKDMVQKAACPVRGRSMDVEAAAACMGRVKPNAVVLEKSGNDEADINTERIAALRNLATQIKKPAKYAATLPLEENALEECVFHLGSKNCLLKFQILRPCTSC